MPSTHVPYKYTEVSGNIAFTSHRDISLCRSCYVYYALLPVLGSGGLIYQGITIYDLSNKLDVCPYYVGLSKSILAALVTVLQILFLVKFALVRRENMIT